jgi:ABC-2 type transport system ATP-binding protein
MTREPAPPVSLKRVVKRLRTTIALAGVSLDVRSGEIVAVLGPNGAGKTTAVRIMLGLRRPDEGEALLFGRDPRDPKSRLTVGATPQELEFPGTLLVREILDFAARHYPAPRQADNLLDQFGLLELARRQVGGLSGGERRRLAVAVAFAGNPAAVFLDEPTTGLDVESRRRVWAAVRCFREGGGTVLLTTHYLEEAEALATRVVLLAKGEVVGDGAPGAVKERLGAPTLEEAFLSLTVQRQ